MQLNIAICDDEPTQIEYLQKLVRSWSETAKYQVSAMTFPSAKAFLFEYSENKSFDIHDELILDKHGKYYELWNAQAVYYTPIENQA